jgi:glycosyltransferase involved in cell wall biosynthesis
VSLARRIIEQEQIDVIITTSPPWSALLAGLLLQKLTGRPWVADMRDPWTTDNVRYVATGLHRWFDQHVESLCLRRANAIISVTPHWLDDLCRLADNDRHGQHFCLITNGYDPDDFPRAGDNESLDYVAPIRLYHPGSVYRGGLGALIYGVEALLQWGAPLDLRFEFVGYMHPDDRQCLNFSSVGAAFHWLPERVPHPIVLSEMHRSHVLLLLLSFDCYPGKLFEYMRVGRPILALAPEGAGANLVRRSGTGCVVDPEDSERLVQVLKQIATDYQGFVAQYYHPDRDVINQYDRRVLTGKLAKILDPLVSARSFIR